MKFTSIIFITVLTIASIEGTAVPSPHDPPSWHGYCYRKGEPCAKLKRAAETAAEAIADPQSCDEHCGEPCHKAKRDALALAEATAEAFAAADPEARPCHAPGAPCSNAKREALDSCEKNPLAQRTPDKSWHGYCYRAGQACAKLKRAAEAVAEAIAQPEQDFETESTSYTEHYSKQKRAIDDVNSLLDKILLR